MAYGFNGRMLEVNLDTGKTNLRYFKEEDYRRCLGGSGLAVEVLTNETDYISIDPLSSSNLLTFTAGLLTGSPIPTACKLSVCAKSPLTGIWGESTVGGYWGTTLRRAGLDGIFIKGKASEPVYLYIDDGKCEIRSAKHIWGKDTYQTSDIIQEETESGVRCATIGIAGENLVKLAGIIVDGRRPRAAGRCGLGAVMGSKNLKSIALKGTQKIEARWPDKLKESIRAFNPELKKATNALHSYGTGGSIVFQEEFGDMPIRNFRDSRWPEGAAKINGKLMVETYMKRHYACHSCPIACGKEIEIKQGPYAPLTGHGAEYETLVALGSLCLNDDLAAILKMNDMCNRYGLDTIETGSCLALAMECYENRLFSEQQLGGMKIKWGDDEVMLKLIEKIAHREGMGDILAEGVRNAAERIDPSAKEYAIHTKGMAMSYHDPRACVGMALTYGLANRGGDHLDALTFYFEMAHMKIPDMPYEDVDPHTEEGKAEMVIRLQNLLSTFNSLGMCKFSFRGLGEKKLSEWIRYWTGWKDFTVEELYKAGERAFVKKRLYNTGLGITRKDDFLPLRLLTLARDDGQAKGVLPNMDKMLGEYYRLRGWSENGRPLEE